MERILHIVGSVERAGIETFLMNLYRHIDKDKYQFDFAIYNEPSNESYREEIEKLGGKCFVLPSKKQGWLRNYKAVKRIVCDNKYNIVWRNCADCVGGIDLMAAKHGGAQVRILHSHSIAGIPQSIQYIFRPIANHYATVRFSCGKRAGRWMFGRRNYELVYNGIDTKDFGFNNELRKKCRIELNIGGKFAIGHVGRFNKVKNQRYLIEIFKEYKDRYHNCALLLVGDGETKNKCEELAYRYGLSEDVIFTGRRNDVAELMQAMDVLVMPSLFEGFPVTMIEAQAAGLPCVVSDSISDETNIYGGVKFVSLSERLDSWCDVIHAQEGKRYIDGNEKMKHAGFDINDTIKQIEDIMRLSVR